MFTFATSQITAQMAAAFSAFISLLNIKAA
jgi:hypothetical protein